jgi:hypothetical protein
MKRVMSITTVLAAVTCHSAYGQLDSVGGAAQNATGQIGSTADSVASQVQSHAGQTPTGASANTQAGTDLNTDSDVNLNTEVNAQAGESTQNQVDRGVRNLNRGPGGISAVVPPIPQQARTGNNGPYDARWRFTQRNGQWWYYSPQNQWMVRQNNEWQNYDDSYQPLAGGNVDQGAYSSGYRGNLSNQDRYPSQQPFQGNNGNAGSGKMQSSQIQMTAHAGPVYMLRYDNTGREYICVQGQRIYFDDQANHKIDRQSIGEENGDQNDRQIPMPNDQRGDERYESGRPTLDATDPADQQPLTEPQTDGENAADATATETPPAPTADSPASADELKPDASDDNNASDEADKPNDDESENRLESENSESEGNGSGDA